MDLRITRAHRIYSDGRHNAFTGIARLGDRVFVTFRTAETHTSMDGAVKVIASQDMEHWDLVCTHEHPALDLRDPKVVALGGRLMVFFGGRHRDPGSASRHDRVSMVTASDDGRTFTEPQAVSGITAGHWLWHVVACNGALYGTAYHNYEAALFRSEDGMAWQKLTDFPVPAGEVFLDAAPDGTLWALLRNNSPGYGPVLCSSKPPYTSFGGMRRLVTKLSGPMLKRLQDGCVIVCRRWDAPGRRNLRSDVLWLRDGHDLRCITRLPSGGDTSYADWLDRTPGRAVISYYSSHEHRMDEPHDNDAVFRQDSAYTEHNTPADIFLADVSYPTGVTP